MICVEKFVNSIFVFIKQLYNRLLDLFKTIIYFLRAMLYVQKEVCFYGMGKYAILNGQNCCCGIKTENYTSQMDPTDFWK